MFIDKYLVSNVDEKPYISDFSDSDQMRYEKRLRERIAKRDLEYPSSIDNALWHYNYSYGTPFVDFSTFYSTLTYVSFEALTYIDSEKEKSLSMVLWTYGAVAIWCNGKKAMELDIPVYKPISKKDFKVDLKKGRNEIYIQFQNLGVRDTRNLFALELLDDSGITITTGREDAECVASWLDGISLCGRTLYFPSPAPKGSKLGRDSKSPDYALVDSRVSWIDIEALKSIELVNGAPYLIVQVPTKDGNFKRFFEIGEMIKPEYMPIADRDENYKNLLKRIANVEGLSRGDKFGFYIQNILARKALGIENPRDNEYFQTTLQQISDRYDCSDFLISGVIRYMKNYPIDDKTLEDIKAVFKDYRYWMTMDGSDAMCFWSENHSLLFYSSAMLVGNMFPDMYFNRAKMTGKELASFGRKLSIEWFKDLEELGFEEFLSTVYMNVTFACLLNIIDYGDEEISKMASDIADKMLRMLALHTFSGVIVAPMGRVYRGIINPTKQGAQALMNIIDPTVPTSFGEGWLSYYATSKYKIPVDAIDLMRNACNVCYSSGNAEIKLLKCKDYALTSVQSPCESGKRRWDNITLEEDVSKYENTHLYTKSFNERFHGTTFFQPGVFGYQQHIWTAALDSSAILFVNHPGSFSDHSSMRPGYWYGNGIMPAVKQMDNVLGAIYIIPDNHPVAFTHVYFPTYNFDSVAVSEHWIFASRNNGYVALWSALDLEKYDDELADSEFRANGRSNGYFCLMGNSDEYKDFDSFINKAKSFKPEYKENTLFINGKRFLEYKVADDRTQYV